LIEVRGIKKSFGSVVAVDDVAFAAGDGLVTGLLGPNGAGKTTTLRVLSTLVKPDAGQALIDGKDAQADSLTVRRSIGVLPDARGLYPRLTAREHVRYFGELQGLRGAELDRRCDELVELLEMRDIVDRRAGGFSQGERVKVALCRALVHRPKNVILDEPTNGLDVMSTRAVREIIRRLRDEGRCVLFSSHVMQEVSALCDRIVVVAHGRVVAEGTADELRARTGCESLEDAFVQIIGSASGLS
jgi:sodium transport system ATP-binding protein